MKKLKSFYDKHRQTSISLIAIFSGLILGAVIMLITSVNPISGYSALLQGAFKTTRRIGETLVYATPIILTGLSVGFAFKTGLFNIGAEGQVIMGTMAGVIVGILCPMPKIFHLPLVILAGAAAGALWAFIPGLLKAKFKIHEVVVSIMLNYTAMYLCNYIYRLLPMEMSIQTMDIAPSASLKSEFLSNITNGSRLNWGIVLVVICVVLYWFILEKTTFGYELKSVGYNKNASEYAGMKVNRNIVLSMMISGAFAGIAGVVVGNGIFSYGRVLTSMENYGFNGIAVTLVGANAPVGITLSGLLFAILKMGGDGMKLSAVPSQIADIVIAFIVMLIAMTKGIEGLIDRISKKERNK